MAKRGPKSKQAPAPALPADPVIERPAQNEEATAPAPTEAPAPVPAEQPTKPKSSKTAPLADYIVHHEKAAQDADLVVTAISHPDAEPRHHDGVYSGFPITAGELSATYSDGSKH